MPTAPEGAQRLPLLLLSRMGVDRHRDLDAAVTGDGLDDVRRHTGIQQQRHAGVAQVMQPDAR